MKIKPALFKVGSQAATYQTKEGKALIVGCELRWHDAAKTDYNYAYRLELEGGVLSHWTAERNMHKEPFTELFSASDVKLFVQNEPSLNLTIAPVDILKRYQANGVHGVFYRRADLNKVFEAWYLDTAVRAACNVIKVHSTETGLLDG